MSELVGHVFVDSGAVIVGDPCYRPDWDAAKVTDYDHCEPFAPGAGVMVSTGYGDGRYPVTVKRNAEGRIKSVTVTFIEN